MYSKQVADFIYNSDCNKEAILQIVSNYNSFGIIRFSDYEYYSEVHSMVDYRTVQFTIHFRDGSTDILKTYSSEYEKYGIIQQIANIVASLAS